MLKKQTVWSIFVFLVLVFNIPVYAKGLVWRFLGDMRIDGAQDHETIRIGDGHGSFRAVQLRVSGDAIFCQRLVVNYGNGKSQELAIGNRVFPEGKTPIIDFAGNPHILESVELWYYKEPWEHRPRVALYGTR